MISVKYDDAKFKAYHGFTKAQPRLIFMKHVVKHEFGGIVKHNDGTLDQWTIEFDNEEDAIAFKLTYGM